MMCPKYRKNKKRPRRKGPRTSQNFRNRATGVSRRQRSHVLILAKISKLLKPHVSNSDIIMTRIQRVVESGGGSQAVIRIIQSPETRLSKAEIVNFSNVIKAIFRDEK